MIVWEDRVHVKAVELDITDRVTVPVKPFSEPIVTVEVIGLPTRGGLDTVPEVTLKSCT